MSRFLYLFFLLRLSYSRPHSFKIRKTTFISSKYIFLFSCNMTISWKKGFIRWRLCASGIFANLFWIACKLAIIADFKPDSQPLQYGSMSQMKQKTRSLRQAMRVLSSNIWKIRLHKDRSLIPREQSCGIFCTVRCIHGNSPEAILKELRKTCFPFGNKCKTTSVTPSDQFT